jgi:hypothetical protein
MTLFATFGIWKRLGRLGAAAALSAGASLAAGCETVQGLGVTSPYVNLDGYAYKYGNFCGAGWPNYPEGNTPEQNIVFLEGIQPLDDVDRVCRAHDRCYFEYGADNAQCDQMLAELLRDQSQTQLMLASGASFLDNEYNGKCANLAGEILSAVGQFKQAQTYTSIADNEEARNQLLGQMGFNAIRNMAVGFPEVPGLCFFNDNQLSSSSSPATQALLAAAQLASSQGVSLTSFEPFFPATEDSLAPARMELMRLQDESSGGGAEDTEKTKTGS